MSTVKPALKLANITFTLPSSQQTGIWKKKYESLKIKSNFLTNLIAINTNLSVEK